MWLSESELDEDEVEFLLLAASLLFWVAALSEPLELLVLPLLLVAGVVELLPLLLLPSVVATLCVAIVPAVLTLTVSLFNDW